MTVAFIWHMLLDFHELMWVHLRDLVGVTEPMEFRPLLPSFQLRYGYSRKVCEALRLPFIRSVKFQRCVSCLVHFIILLRLHHFLLKRHTRTSAKINLSLESVYFSPGLWVFFIYRRHGILREGKVWINIETDYD